MTCRAASFFGRVLDLDCFAVDDDRGVGEAPGAGVVALGIEGQTVFEEAADAGVAAQNVDFEPFRRAVEIECAAVVAEGHGYDIGLVLQAEGQAHDLAGADDALHFLAVGDFVLLAAHGVVQHGCVLE
jgi:hypothetical protein